MSFKYKDSFEVVIGLKDGLFVEPGTGWDERLTFEIYENNDTVEYNLFQVNILGLSSSSKALLKGVAKKYGEDVSEHSESEISFVLEVEKGDTPRRWVLKIVHEMGSLASDYNKTGEYNNEF